MPTSTFRRLVVALTIGAGLWLATAGGAAASAPTSGDAPTTTSSASTSSTTVTTTPRPSVPKDEFEPEDAIDWAKDNLSLIIIVVGLLLLVGLWKYISRPRTKKF